MLSAIGTSLTIGLLGLAYSLSARAGAAESAAS